MKTLASSNHPLLRSLLSVHPDVMKPFWFITAKWRDATLDQRLYFLGETLAFVTAALLIALRPQTFTSLSWPSLCAMLLITLGFLAWVIPRAIRLWHSKYGRYPFLLLNGLAVPFAFGVSRHATATATQLPPQSFDLTVMLFALLAVPVIWCIIVSVGLVVGMCIAGLVLLLARLAQSVVGPISIFSSGNVTQRLDLRLRSFQNTVLRNLVGMSGAGIVIGVVVAGYSSAFMNTAVIRLIAYKLDFAHAARYPAIDHADKMRLLDNGVIAYARMEGLSVKFKVCESLNTKCADVWY